MSRRLYLAVNEDGKEIISQGLPKRKTNWFGILFCILGGCRVRYWSGKNVIILPPGTIWRLTGRVMTWKSDPFLFEKPNEPWTPQIEPNLKKRNTGKYRKRNCQK